MNNWIFKYYCGAELLIDVRPVRNAQFDALGGTRSKHNRYDGFNRMAGIGADGFLKPVTRRIEYKARPSLHKCDARCMSATGHVCECSCGGENHGRAA